MSDMSQKPISSLAKECAKQHASDYLHEDCHGRGWWFYLFWFLVVGIITWFLLFALRPDFVLKCDDKRSKSRSECRRDDEVDQGKVLLWAVVIALIAVFLLWLFQWGVAGHY